MRWKRLTRLVYGMAIASGFAVAVLGPAMPALRDELGISRTVGGLHFSALALGAVVSGFTVEAVTRALSRTTTFWVASTGIAAGCAVVAIGPNALITIAGALIVGMCGAAMLSVSQASLVGSDEHDQAVRLSQLHASTSFGSVLPAFAVAALIVAGLGWRPAFLVPIVVVGALAAVFRTVAFPPPPSGSARHDGRRALPLAYWIFWTAFIPAVGAEWSIGAWGAGYLVDIIGSAPATAALVMVSFFGAISLGRLIGSRLARWVAPFPLLATSSALALGGFAVLVTSESAQGATLGLFITGLGISVAFPLLLTMAMAAAPDRPDEASAKTFISAGASVAVAPFILGALSDSIGLSRAFLMVPALLILAVVLAGLGRWSAERNLREASSMS